MKSLLLKLSVIIILIAIGLMSCVSQDQAKPEAKPGRKEAAEQSAGGSGENSPADLTPVHGDFQVWADKNKNGKMEPGEIENLVMTLVKFFKDQTHDVKTPMDEFFDLNKDGFIGPEEYDFVREVYFRTQLTRLQDFFPQVAKFLDLNDNGKVDGPEPQLVIDMFFLAPEMRKPHPAENPLDKRVDRNSDGRVDEVEIEQMIKNVFVRVVLIPFSVEETRGEAQAFRDRQPILNMLDEIKDTNHDGFVGPMEVEQAEMSLNEPHEVRNPFDERIDINKNGRVESFEIEKARQAGGIPVEKQEEIAELPVTTPAEREIDLNGDGRITREEIRAFVAVLFRGPGKAAPGNRQQKFFDRNNDGVIREEELVLTKERFFLPHPVDKDWVFDRESDKNRDGFVSPEEIGVPAGRSAGLEFPSFDALVEQARWQGSAEISAKPGGAERPATTKTAEQADANADASAAAGTASAAGVSATEEAVSDAGFRDFQEKIKSIDDKKLAVVGISSNTKNVDAETTIGIMAFIENAFVNISKAKVVDRSAINRIIEEYKFQASGYVDENTAVEIGKLAGADIIVIGSVNFVGEKYYLNVKLISVLTAEIFGSSIAESSGSSEFYNMVNSAVLKLF